MSPAQRDLRLVENQSPAQRVLRLVENQSPAQREVRLVANLSPVQRELKRNRDSQRSSSKSPVKRKLDADGEIPAAGSRADDGAGDAPRNSAANRDARKYQVRVVLLNYDEWWHMFAQPIYC